MQPSSLRQALADLPIGPIKYYDSIGSTNDEAARWALADAPDMALVIADEQTAGRGRAGRAWFTPPGAALAFSVIMKAPFQRQGTPDTQRISARLTGLGALAVSQALNQDYGLSTQIKWPNDILLEGRKVAGVLVEANWQGSELISTILGIGVNVFHESVPSTTDWILPATCVQGYSSDPVSRTSLLRSILRHLLEWRLPLENVTKFVSAWESNLAYIGEWVQISSPELEDKIIHEGQVVGLDSSGRLKLRSKDGNIEKIHSGEIHLRPTPSDSHS